MRGDRPLKKKTDQNPNLGMMSIERRRCRKDAPVMRGDRPLKKKKLTKTLT